MVTNVFENLQSNGAITVDDRGRFFSTCVPPRCGVSLVFNCKAVFECERQVIDIRVVFLGLRDKTPACAPDARRVGSLHGTVATLKNFIARALLDAKLLLIDTSSVARVIAS